MVGKYQGWLLGFDDHVISMYARGMGVCEIQGHLLELYGLEVSPDLILTATDEVLAEVELWQQRPLEAMYPIVYFGALRLKIRDEGTVKNKVVYLALGIRADGCKEVLGLWIEQSEGAKFWLKVFNELKNRRLARHPDRGGRRFARVPRSDRGGVSDRANPDLHRAFDPQVQPQLAIDPLPCR